MAAGPTTPAAAAPGEAAAAAPEDNRLLDALRRAEPRGPRGLAKRDPGAALALAAHCCMLESGFQVDASKGGAQPPSRHSPAPGWDKQFPDEWVFEYTHPRKDGRFALHCSLQRVSGRMLVSGMEVGAPKNRHMLGLMLSNYVAGGPGSLDTPDWSGVIARQGTISDMFKQHVAEPLLAMASDHSASAPGGRPAVLEEQPSEAERRLKAAGGGRAGGWAAALDAWLPPAGSAERRHVLAAASVLTAAGVVAVAAVAVAHRRRAGGAGGAGAGVRGLFTGQW